MSAISRAERRRLETRAELVRAAIDTFVERGYHPTRISDIVGRFGAGQGTFYRYFDSKRDVLDAVLESALGRLHEVFGAQNAPERIGSLAEYTERAGDILDRVEQLADEERALVRFLALELPSVEGAVPHLLSLSSVFETVFAEYYRAGIQRGYFRADIDVPAAATATVGLGVGFALTLLRYPSDPGLRRNYRATMLNFILRYAAEAQT